MIRRIGSLAVVSLLALCGCVAYPYGGYYGYGGYGGYPYSAYPYSSGPYGAPGYSYDPYASQYGYGYGYSPGVVVPVPAPPVVVENPPSGVVESSQGTWVHQGEIRRSRQLAKERWRDRFNNNNNGGSNVPGDQPTNPDSTTPVPPGDSNPNTGGSGQTAGDWRRARFGNGLPRTGDGSSSSGRLDQARRFGPGSVSPSTSTDPVQGSGTGQTGRNAHLFMNRGTTARSQMQAAPQFRPNMGATPVTPQMRQGPILRQPGGPAPAPRVSPSPSPRPMMAATPQTAARPQVSGQPKGTAREARPRFQ